MFKKGDPKPPTSGRKKGGRNKKRLPKVSEFLAEIGLNPLAELIDMLEETDPDKVVGQKLRADIWMELLSYCEAKPKHIDLEGEDDDLSEFDDIPNSEFLKLIKKPEEVS